MKMFTAVGSGLLCCASLGQNLKSRQCEVGLVLCQGLISGLGATGFASVGATGFASVRRPRGEATALAEPVAPEFLATGNK